MGRGHPQKRLGEGWCVSPALCVGAALSCVCLEDGCPHSCVLGVVVLRVTVPVSELPVVSLCVGVSVLQGCGSV